VVILFLATSPAFAVTIDFNTPGDLLGNFNQNCNTSPPDYIEVTSGGIASTGAVGFNTTIRDTTAVYKNESYSFVGGTILMASAFFMFNPTASTGSLMQVGFLGQDDWQFRAGGYVESEFRTFVCNRLVYDPAGTNTVYFQTQQRYGLASDSQLYVWGYTANGQWVTRTKQLTPGNWYKFTGIFQEDPALGADRIKTTNILEDWGDGTAYSSTVYQYSGTFSQPNPIANDPDVYAAFKSMERGASMVDNFYADVVPEPLTAASVILGCGSLASYVRRRKQ
jgi:hypothetical protein